MDDFEAKFYRLQHVVSEISRVIILGFGAAAGWAAHYVVMDWTGNGWFAWPAAIVAFVVMATFVSKELDLD